MSETNPEPNLQRYAEAVIISGPRKGEFITVPEDGDQLSPEIEAMLDSLIIRASSMAESAKAAGEETRSLLEGFRQTGELMQDTRERLARLEAAREADRAQLAAEVARFKAEYERAELKFKALLSAPSSEEE